MLRASSPHAVSRVVSPLPPAPAMVAAEKIYTYVVTG
jgi:hypothetical protein